MKNKLLLTVLALLLVPGVALAQSEWEEVQAPVHLQYEDMFYAGPIVHGLVVDDQDRLWICNYGGGEEGQGLVILNQDGTPADISPITSVDVNGTALPTVSGCTGISEQPDGNILASFSSGLVIRIDAETGEGLNFWEGPSSLTSAGADEEGYVYVSIVAGTPPIRVLNDDMSAVSFEFGSVEEYNWWSRSIDVTPDGMTVASGRLGGGVVVYQSEDLVNYELTDTLLSVDGSPVFAGDVSTVQFDDEGLLWVTDEGAGYPDPEHTRNIKVLDIEQKTYYTLDHDSLDVNPRGIAWSNDGERVFVASFYNGYTRSYTLGAGPVSNEEVTAPVAFSIEPNYPNPFSSSTTIKYALNEPGSVTLRVYDVLGREVKTLVSARQAAGPQTATWDATDAAGQRVASGTYFYMLEVEGQRVTRAMVVTK